MTLDDFDGPTGEIASVNEKMYRRFVLQQRENKISNSAPLGSIIILNHSQSQDFLSGKVSNPESMKYNSCSKKHTEHGNEVDIGSMKGYQNTASN